ncbi:hypothetical protein DFJ77DRAFT_318521 [Powellomyces hirtus]|nr:hypothetical protein DFJ77DRAFT_318521 [Powellomyces hirtus]
MGIKVPSPTRPKLLFTTRPCPQSRCIVNESELIAMLTENFGDVMDIELVNFQGMNLRQQIEAVQGATILMGSSGTGTHNGIFLRNGSALVDIVSDTVNVGQVASEYFVNAHICNANSPSVILCHPMYEKPETNLTRTELINHTDWIMVRSLPLRVHLRRMRLTVETSILNHGLNEELINEMLTAQISERGHAYKFWS